MSKKEKDLEVVSVEGVKEVPENEEIIDEVPEDVVQAVAEAIDEFAKEENKKVEEVVNDIIEEAKEDAGEYTGDLRGFKTLEEAKNYPNTPEFKKLDIGCRTEYVAWLKSIMKED
jgi:hypothetical protein